MAELNTHTCDVCPAIKKDVNHWYVLRQINKKEANNHEEGIPQLIVMPYTKETASLKPCYHLCGQACLQKKVLELSAELFT